MACVQTATLGVIDKEKKKIRRRLGRQLELSPSMDRVQIFIDELRASGRLGPVEKYFYTLQHLTVDLIVDDFVHWRVTAATVTLSITAVTTLLVLGSALGMLGGGGKKKRKSKKKRSRLQRANAAIQAILDHVEHEYIPQIEEFVANPRMEDSEYKYNYLEEMLLKQLMALDGIEVDGNEVLRDNRKKVIKFIQEHQRRLDRAKKGT